MHWCIEVGGTFHAVLGDFDPRTLPEPEDARSDHVMRGRATQRSCDQHLVDYESVTFGLPNCDECLHIKSRMFEMTAAQATARDLLGAFAREAIGEEEFNE